MKRALACIAIMVAFTGAALAQASGLINRTGPAGAKVIAMHVVGEG